MRTRLPRDERGVALVLMVLFTALVLGMAALTIDYGMIKSETTEAQRAVDAAALAGASSLIVANPAYDKYQGAIDTASKYALLHSVGVQPIVSGEVTIEPDLTANTVRVSWARMGIRTWFANGPPRPPESRAK